MTEDELQILYNVESILTSISQGYDCDSIDGIGDCTDVNPCHICQIREANKLINEAHQPVHEGYHYERTKSNGTEHSYVETWKAWNKRSPEFLPQLLGREAVDHRTCRDIATVIQWLGTNCGKSIVQESEINGKQLTDDQYKLGLPYTSTPPKANELNERMAYAISCRFFTEENTNHKRLYKAILLAFEIIEDTKKADKFMRGCF